MKAVIFDLDDTLVSEHEFMLSGYMAVAKDTERLLPDVWQDIFERMVQLSREDTRMVFNRLLDSYHLYYDRDDIKDMVKRYREHMPKISFYEDAVPALTALRAGGIRTGIISDGYPLMQHNKIHACGGESYFDEIIITDELGGDVYHKPDRRSFDRMASDLETDLTDMLYVGDNPEKDFYISKVCGVKTARIIREDGIYRDRQYRGGIKENFRIRSLTDITALEGIK